MKKLKTFMSPVVWFSMPSNEGESTMTPIEVQGRPLHWLDEMLEGGIALPKDLWNHTSGSPSFLMLLAGPPGSGKTTFAIELCYNLARFQQPDGKSLTSLYVSSETPGNRILENARAFDWDEKHFTVLSGTSTDLGPGCSIYGSEHVPSILTSGRKELSDFFAKVSGMYTTVANRNMVRGDPNQPNHLPPDVVVIDSLNLLWPHERAFEEAFGGVGDQPGTESLSRLPSATRNSSGLLEAFYQLRADLGGGRTAMRPKLLVIVLDSCFEDGSRNPWEFLADAIFRFDGTMGPENYYTRAFQIVKIKTQTHAIGKNHAYKVVPHRKQNGPATLTSGGTFVFPSVHWHLSRLSRDDPAPGFTRETPYPTGLDGLNTLLSGGRTNSGGGFPHTHTTALVGERGGMKSYLAYHFMISHAIGAVDEARPKNVLLISLQDDIVAAKNTLVELIKQQDIAGLRSRAAEVVDALCRSDRLEILYNWPGYVTTNEFFHRVFVALARTRRGDPWVGHLSDGAKQEVRHGLGTGQAERRTAEIVVVSGLEHLDVKFPLCASEKMFVPALVSLFRYFKVCSVVISAEHRKTVSHDIRPLSDLILEFADCNEDERRLAGEALSSEQYRKVTASRVPAGQVGGLWGVLWRRTGGAMDFSCPAGMAGRGVGAYSMMDS